jgi:glycosyl transferase family 2
MSELLAYALLVTGILIFIASIDDLIVDVLAFFKIHERSSDESRLLPDQNDAEPGPRIAVFVANWKEADVLGKMVEGNLANIGYRPFTFVLGVYPNDLDTRRVAEELSRKHPELVQVVVNRMNGPTSKGQMLNEMFSRVYAEPATAPGLVVLHDSEDIIDPRSFALYATRSAEYAFIQIPVFSLDSRRRSNVGATYMEEFAERHTGEMLVRDALGSFIPSAGVGTCLRKDLILHFIAKRGFVLQPGSVTEDYILGAETHREGYRSTFAALLKGTKSNPNIVATLEYFPRSFRASVKQKSRWVYGIAFEGTWRLGWSHGLCDLFFFYRDRKGAITNLLPPLSLLLLAIALATGVQEESLSPTMASLLRAVLLFNGFVIAVRLYCKVIAFRAVYGSFGLLGILVRWPLAIAINAAAVLLAWRTFLVESRFASRPISWVKTQHELPRVFELLTGRAVRRAPARLAAAIGSTSSALSAIMGGIICLYVGALVLQPPIAPIDGEKAGSETLTLALDGLTMSTLRAQGGANGHSTPSASADAAEALTQARNSVAAGYAADQVLMERVLERRRYASFAPSSQLAGGDDSALDALAGPNAEEGEQARSIVQVALAAGAARDAAILERALEQRRPQAPTVVVVPPIRPTATLATSVPARAVRPSRIATRIAKVTNVRGPLKSGGDIDVATEEVKQEPFATRAWWEY